VTGSAANPLLQLHCWPRWRSGGPVQLRRRKKPVAAASDLLPHLFCRDEQCLPGSYMPNIGGTECFGCEPGRCESPVLSPFSLGLSGVSVVHSYQAGGKASTCLSCAAGRSSRFRGQAACQPCNRSAIQCNLGNVVLLTDDWLSLSLRSQWLVRRGEQEPDVLPVRSRLLCRDGSGIRLQGLHSVLARSGTNFSSLAPLLSPRSLFLQARLRRVPGKPAAPLAQWAPSQISSARWAARFVRFVFVAAFLAFLTSRRFL
jgi:hypothetical protein